MEALKNKKFYVIINSSKWYPVEVDKKDFCSNCEARFETDSICKYVNCKVFDKLFNWKKAGE